MVDGGNVVFEGVSTFFRCFAEVVFLGALVGGPMRPARGPPPRPPPPPAEVEEGKDEEGG